MVFLLKLFRRDSKEKRESVECSPVIEEKETDEINDDLTESNGSNYSVILRVGNIPWTTTPSEVHTIFSKYGNCKIENCETERMSKSFCLDFCYADHTEGEKALSHDRKVKLKGQELQVRIVQLVYYEEIDSSSDCSSSSGSSSGEESESPVTRSQSAAIRRRRKMMSGR